MAIKTVTGGVGGADFTPGWKELTIKNAKYGTYNTNKYIDIWFEDYPENLNCRAYEAINKQTKEEFRIANWFKFANAGIQEVIDNGSKKPVITYDDDPENLVGTKINVFFYKEKGKDGDREYSRIWREPAPTVMETDQMVYTEGDCAYWMNRAERSYLNYKSVKNGASSSMPTDKASNEVPF